MTPLQSIRGDLVHAMRTLAKERAFTLVCVVSLGIGMGAVVALATFGRAITAQARGINTDGLVEVLVLPQGPLREKAGVWALERWSYPDYQALRDADVGMDVTGWSLDSSEFGEPTPDQKAPLRVPTLYVSPNYFRTFGVPLARGPGFDAAHDDSPSAEPRVILSHDFWTSRVGADPDIVGKSVVVDGVPHTVVGITPDDFRGHFHFFQSPPSLLFVPLERHPHLRQEPNLRNDRTAEWVRIHGRLAPGVSLIQANGLVALGRGDAGEPIPRDEPVQGGHRGAVRAAGCRWPSGVDARVQRPLEPGGRGAADRVREYLGNDADPRRHAGARAVDSRRARRRPAGPRAASVLRSARAGGCRRHAQCGRGVRHSGADRMVDGRAGSSRGRLRCGGRPGRGGPLPGGQCALRIAASHSLQPPKPAAGAAGERGPRRHPEDSCPSHRRHGADRRRRAVSGDERRDDRSRADGGLRISARRSGGGAHPRVGQAARRRVHPVGRRRSPAGGRRALGGGRRRDAH